MLALPGK